MYYSGIGLWPPFQKGYFRSCNKEDRESERLEILLQVNATVRTTLGAKRPRGIVGVNSSSVSDFIDAVVGE